MRFYYFSQKAAYGFHSLPLAQPSGDNRFLHDNPTLVIIQEVLGRTNMPTFPT
jgi:hypothetical protein